mmetsp:Transcript_44421/g.128563  ORF Transcript_44421/g.128563 Transcript_44421/m.128563 type:complete len:271 (+) Transcript_44421:608-1420(+)
MNVCTRDLQHRGQAGAPRQEAQLLDFAAYVLPDALLGLPDQRQASHCLHHACRSRFKGGEQLDDWAALVVRAAEDGDDPGVVWPGDGTVVAGESLTVKLAADGHKLSHVQATLLQGAMQAEAVNAGVVPVLHVCGPDLSEHDRSPLIERQAVCAGLLDAPGPLARDAAEDHALQEAVAAEAVAAVHAARGLPRREEPPDRLPLAQRALLGVRLLLHLGGGADLQAAHAVVDARSDPRHDKGIVLLLKVRGEHSLVRFRAYTCLCCLAILP